MNMRHDDEQIIKRLRSALDEVATAARQEERAMMPFKSPSGVPRRWIAIAAASLLLIGGAVFALARRDGDEPAAPADTVAPTSPGTVVTTPASTAPDAGPGTSIANTTEPATTVAPSTTAPAAAMPWFELDAPGFTAGSIEHVDGDPANPYLVQSWAVTQEDGPGFLSVSMRQGLEPGIEGDYTSEDVTVPEGVAYFLRPNGPDGTGPLDWGYELRWFHDDGSAWLFQSSGLSRERLVELATEAVPGSGLPMVIDDPDLAVLSSGVVTGGLVAQQYTDDGQGHLMLWVEQEGRGIIDLISAANIIPTTVDGTPGYAALMGDNQVFVTWDAGNGWWGHLTIGRALSRAADGLIAEVVAADFPG
jgi:hypothetical protein